MKQLGFGILKNGRPTGLWPKPLERALSDAKKEDCGSQKGQIEVVPVYIGGPVYPVKTASHSDPITPF